MNASAPVSLKVNGLSTAASTLVGVAVLIVVLAIIVWVFDRAHLTSKAHALGLPRGSVRALIALTLIMIFVILSNTIFRTLNAAPRSVSFSGLTAEQVGSLPGPVTSQQGDGTRTLTTSKPTSTTPVYKGSYQTDASTVEGRTIGTQLVTALVTLVAAVSAFYFGSANATDARGRNKKVTLSVLKPGSPYQLAKSANGKWDVVQITLSGSALDSGAANGSIKGDDDNTLVGTGPNSFSYTPKQPQGQVVITFNATVDSSIVATLILSPPP